MDQLYRAADKGERPRYELRRVKAKEFLKVLVWTPHAAQPTRIHGRPGIAFFQTIYGEAQLDYPLGVVNDRMDCFLVKGLGLVGTPPTKDRP